jgi:phosphonate transport system permease protein
MTATESADAALRIAHPALFGPSPATRRLRAVFGALAVLAVLGAFWRTGFLDATRLWQGLGKLGWLLQFMLPPAHNGWLLDFLHALAETLGMALFGTALAFVIAVPLGFLAARNILPLNLLRFPLRRGLDGLRGIDTLIWALIFVNVVGLGPFAGVLAIAAADIGVLAKIIGEAVENADRRQIEGVRSTGAGRLQTLRFGIVPQVSPVILSNGLYFLESNVRSASILGVVGAGGIGQELSDRIRINNWDEAMFLILLILVAVWAIDTMSASLRMRLIGRASTRHIGDKRPSP